MQRGKTSMKPIEELFIINLMCSSLPLSPEYAALVRCVAVFFPRRYSFMEKNKNSDVFAQKARVSIVDENQSVSASGEETVKNLFINLLRRKIQTRHFNIVQIAFNMGKLAGVYMNCCPLCPTSIAQPAATIIYNITYSAYISNFIHFISLGIKILGENLSTAC